MPDQNGLEKKANRNRNIDDFTTEQLSDFADRLERFAEDMAKEGDSSLSDEDMTKEDDSSSE